MGSLVRQVCLNSKLKYFASHLLSFYSRVIDMLQKRGGRVNCVMMSGESSYATTGKFTAHRKGEGELSGIHETS